MTVHKAYSDQVHCRKSDVVGAEARLKPLAPIGERNGYASVMSDGRAKASFDAERAKMVRRSVRPSSMEIRVFSLSSR